ncbi:uncharacterized protein LOC126978576 [Leptidea sinapis]|uniref:uncharacterized protein LOC126978576 n=1 Tax=Leptidea sinapis TaxID=189913 RepID=UPI0021C430C5|nr:uncharacterized protein LOC126978576 [Leptidea sinapis]
MQSSLPLRVLGQVWYKPVRDAGGTVVVSCVGRARGARAGALSSRWVPLHKLRRRPGGEEQAAADLLLASVPHQIHYHQVCRSQLARGLYVGYLKLQSSLEVARLVVPARAPNVPPHARVRHNPHVAGDEWEYLKNQSCKAIESQHRSTLSVSGSDKPSESQLMFVQQLATATRRLLRDMDINEHDALLHRVYDLEVIEFSGDVSFIMICPPAEQACSVPGQREILLQKGDLLSLPIQAFEMIHLQTYHSNILNRYSRLSCLLELDVALATHAQREAFSSTELQTAKDRLAKLEDLQNSLTVVWKSERWLMDLISFARDKDKTSSSSGILLKYLLENEPSANITGYTKDSDQKLDFLQIPARDGKITKTSPGRGSWPGPAGNGSANLYAEFSKSDQQLSLAPRQTSVSSLNLSSSQYLDADSKYPRKGSADSQSIQRRVMIGDAQSDVMSSSSQESATGRLPPSRSEDTLVLQTSNENGEPRPRPQSITASLSTSSSPMLTVRGVHPGGVLCTRTAKSNESAQSLSSDSETQSCTTVPKLNPLTNRVMPSKSMNNMKTDEEQSSADAVEGESRERNVKRVPLMETAETLGHKVARTADGRAEREQPGILQVFAAYDTGLAAGTSLKLHVTPRTTAREVIELVVKQLNMATVLKGRAGPVYPPQRLPDFCLVAVIGARERCLRDDFRPLQLQNPWRRGRLYVRLRHDVLAALSHSAARPAHI